jgi:hypothetical protein
MTHATEQAAATPACPPASPTHPAAPGENAAAGATGGQGGALTHEQLAAITLARRQGRKISRAATVATISGWTLAFFAFISVLMGLFSLVLGVMILFYCSWGIWQAVFGPGPYDSYYAEGGDTAEMIQSIDQLNRAMISAFYTVLICVSVIAQGFTSLYYFSRRRHMIAYLTKTPAWVIEALRVAAH